MTQSFAMTLIATTAAGAQAGIPKGTYIANAYIGLAMYNPCGGDSYASIAAKMSNGTSGTVFTPYFSYTIPTSCTLTSTTAVAFGTVSNTTSAKNASGSIYTLCNTPYTITLGDGNNRISGSYRRMTNGNGQYLPYQIYTDSTYSTPWAGTTTVSGVADTTGAAVATPVYAQIPAGTALPTPGSYSDSVVVTVSY